MARHRVVRSVLLAALVGATVIAPLTTQRTTQAAKVSKLVVDWDVSDAKSLDPGHMYEFTGVLVGRQTYDTLVTLNGGDMGHLLPDLATSWTVSGGGTIFTFKLRQGVKFTSGNPVTADDVVFSFKRLSNLNDNPAPLAATIKDITAVDPSTVKITLKTADVSFLATLPGPNFAVLDSKTVMAQGGTDAADAKTSDKAKAYLDGASAGSGPYILKEWTRNTRIVLDRNPGYWGPAPYFQEVIINGVKDPETQKLQVQKGDADVALGLTLDQANTLKGDPNVQVTASPTLDYAYLAMNVSPDVSKPLSNPLVRQAVRYTIDYKGIISKLFNGEAEQPASVIPIGYVGNSAAQNAAQRIKTDVNKAKTLLKQAGYANGFSVTLTFPTKYTGFDGIDFDALAAKIINDLKAIGITATPKGEQVSVYLADFRAAKQQLILAPWGADYPDAYDNLSYFGPGGNVGKRVTYLQDGNLGALILKGDATGDPASRGTIYNQVQQGLIKTGPYAVLLQPDYPVVLRTGIKGFAYAPIWKADFYKLSK